MKEKILITSALPYANGPLHFGHIAGAYLPADVYARYQRLRKNDVLYVCGSDEYGIAITLSAEMANRTPQEHVDIYHEMNKNFFDILNISFDNYSRTTYSDHAKTAQEFFLKLLENGYIEEKTEDHLFSEEENRFLADRYVIGTCPKCAYDKARGDECPKCAASYEALDLKNPKSKLTGSKLIKKPSKHWYMRFDKFKNQLSKWLETKDWKQNVLNFAKEYVKDLKPRAITRDSSWGIEVPLEKAKGKVLYVWFDAPIGYISATKEYGEEKKDPDLWKKYWLDPKTKLVNFIGKDNIPFHAVFFPAMIMGMQSDYKLVDEVPANEFLMLEGRQFSKSDNWYIDLTKFFTKFTSDQIRYYLASIAPETHDSDFIWKDFQVRCNSELLGKLGNFVNRVLVFTKNNLGSKVPKLHKLEEVDRIFQKDILKHIDAIQDAYESFKVKKASQIIMDLAQSANVYFDHKKPWKLVKDPSQKENLESTINLCLEAAKALALISFPIIPNTANDILQMLGFSKRIEDGSWDDIKNKDIPENQSLPHPRVLFKKIEDKDIEEEIMDLKEDKQEENLPVVSHDPLKEEIVYKDFDKVDMRVGKVIKAEKIKGSKKLLLLEVDLGFEKRQIVSGIAHCINPDSLLGKKVIVVANLKPAKIMGYESNGMILAAGPDEDIEIPFIQTLNPGSQVS